MTYMEDSDLESSMFPYYITGETTMAGFEHGEKLVCLTKVKVDDKTFQPGDDFPYIDMNVDPALVDSLMSQRKVARAAHVSQETLAELRKEKVEKIIRNFDDGRVAVSWPRSEPLPPGVIDGRPEHLRGELVAASPAGSDEDPNAGGDDDPNGDGGDPNGGDDDPNAGGDPNADGDKSIQIVPADGVGWFNVMVDGIPVNTKKLRKRDAIKLKEEYKGSASI